MIFKTFFSSRTAASKAAHAESGAGDIVFLMMGLVFVPIVLAHAAVMLQGDFGAQQLGAIVNVLLRTF